MKKNLAFLVHGCVGIYLYSYVSFSWPLVSDKEPSLLVQIVILTVGLIYFYFVINKQVKTISHKKTVLITSFTILAYLATLFIVSRFSTSVDSYFKIYNSYVPFDLFRLPIIKYLAIIVFIFGFGFSYLRKYIHKNVIMMILVSFVFAIVVRQTTVLMILRGLTSNISGFSMFGIFIMFSISMIPSMLYLKTGKLYSPAAFYFIIINIFVHYNM